MPPGVVALALTLLLGLQPITTDLYLPALPTLQRALGTTVHAAQLTLSALIIAFGLGQLVCGPLSDRFGRRPVLLAGMALYTLASAFGAAASTIDALIGWRIVQGAAMAAAVAGARSIVRDLYRPLDGARMMSRALGGLGVIGMLCPIVGGLAVHFLDWHATLGATALFGAATFAYIALCFRESLPAPNADALRPSHLLRNWGRVCAHPTFRAWTALLCCTYGGLFVMLAGSAFVYIDVLGTSRAAYGLILSTSSVAYIGGTLLCRRLLRRHGLRGAVRRGAVLSLTGGAGMAALSLAGWHTVWAIMLPQLLYAFGHGIHQPCGQAGVTGPFPDKAGIAASVSGFAMTLVAFFVGIGLGRTLGDSVYPVTLGVGVFSVALAAVAWTLVQRDGEPAAWSAAAAPAR